MPKRAMPLIFLMGLLPGLATAQVPLGEEFRVNAYTTGSQGQPAVGCAGNGRCVMVWNSFGQDGHRGGVFAQRYDPSGAPLGVEFQVNVTTLNAQHAPEVAVDPDGTFMVVWTGQDDLSAGDYSYGGVFARRYDADGNGGPEFQVNTYVDGLQGGQKVAAIFPGYFVVVWTDYGQYNYGRVLGKIYDPFDLVVAEGPIGTVDGSRRPAVGAGGGSGEFVVVWSRYATGWDVFGKRFSFGTLLTPEFRANAGSAGSQDEAAVAVLSNGDFVVTWQDTRLSGYQFVSSVRGQRLQANGTWAGGDFQVNGSAVEVPQRPAVAASANAAGGFVVAWTSNSDGSGAGVSARHFAPVAPGEPFRVNSYTTGAQRAPSISFTGTDRFVVAWASSGQDGSEYGVFGRRYSTDVSLDVIFKDCFSPGCP